MMVLRGAEPSPWQSQGPLTACLAQNLACLGFGPLAFQDGADFHLTQRLHNHFKVEVDNRFGHTLSPRASLTPQYQRYSGSC